MSYLNNNKYVMAGAIPRFPVWESIVMVFLVVYGAVGTVSQNTGSMYYRLLGSYSDLWFAVMFLCGVLAIVAMWMRIPDGLYLHLAVMALLSAAAFSMLIALVALQERAFFSGSTLLYIFSFGSLFRMLQVMSQLKRLRRVLDHERDKERAHDDQS